ncbi:MAG: nitrous oxide reductase family maturation protein NosD [Verrucomicrobiae bacterium]|nr:nitrous oxide reductase family maturation protein NosD [Verrucomicrobiae bacterium]NNJ41813.1 nitrous oxide reductase family maturation protein NosD [Akkermansiaceae bacterium]
MLFPNTASLLSLSLLFHGIVAGAIHRPHSAATLTEALATCVDGDEIVLAQGTYVGNFKVQKSIRLTGKDAVLDGAGNGTVLTLAAPKAVLTGIKVRNSGTNLSGPDCGIYLAPEASGSHVTKCHIESCAFGIWVHECKSVTLEGNRIMGIDKGHTSNRGNGIQLFDSTDVTCRNNIVRDGRDGIYISATEESLIDGNDIERARYGIHYMYSYSNTVRNNVCRRNNNGYALMESKHLFVENNRSEYNDGQGLQFRDAQYCEIKNNQLIGNTEGLFFYSSTNNKITGNLVQGNQTGVKIWAGSLRNDVSGNRFIGNARQVFYVGTTEIEWGNEDRGNYWSDYLGWDQDGDGIGDRPYRVNSFHTQLLHRFPSASLLMNSPSLETLSLLERRLPFLRTPTITDRKPLLNATYQENE